MAADESHLFNVFGHPEQVFVRGQGMFLFDDKGDRYLDFIGGIAVNALGHCHPKLVEAVTKQANEVWHISNMYKIPGQEQLAEKYCAESFADVVFFVNSGTEAMELALKTARKYHAVNGNPEKVDIIGFSGSFHGRSYAAINAAGNPGYLDGFGPPLPGYKHCAFGDWARLETLVDANTAGILIEPVQGEGGCQVIPDDVLKQMRALCDKHGALLIFDEVQCGAGRTGKLWAHQWTSVTPDIMAAAKGIGGGFPLGACLATREAAAGMVKGTHGSTYGGNPLAMAVGGAAWDVLAGPGFLERARDMANHLGQAMEGLKDRHSDLIEETRGRGLLRGLKLKVDNKLVQAIARDQFHLLVGVAGDNVLRLAPALILEVEDVSRCADLLDATFDAVRAELAKTKGAAA